MQALEGLMCACYGFTFHKKEALEEIRLIFPPCESANTDTVQQTYDFITRHLCEAWAHDPRKLKHYGFSGRLNQLNLQERQRWLQQNEQTYDQSNSEKSFQQRTITMCKHYCKVLKHSSHKRKRDSTRSQ